MAKRPDNRQNVRWSESHDCTHKRVASPRAGPRLTNEYPWSGENRLFLRYFARS